MKARIREFLPLFGLIIALGAADTLRAAAAIAPPPPAPVVEVPQAVTPTADLDVEADAGPAERAARVPDIVAVGRDAELAAGHVADSVVAVLGSARSAGEVKEAIVAVFGDTHVSGPVGDDAVAVFGSNHVDASVKGDAVAVFGDLELGPRAAIGGDAVAVGGAVHRNPAASVKGETVSVLPGAAHVLDGLRPWFRHCLLLARPLAFAPGLGWAWGLAFGFLALYVLLALLAGAAVQRCAETLETRPGQTLLASLLAVLLVPVLLILLAITVIGLAVVPFVGLGVVAATLFGKAVVLAVLGRLVLRAAGRGDSLRTALAVIVGGLIVMVLYCIPVIGFIVFKLIGVVGFGTVFYTLYASTRTRGAAAAGAPVEAPQPQPAVPPPPAPATAGAADAAAEATPPAAPAVPAVPPTSLPRAGFWIRIAALFVDFILVAIAVGILRLHGNLLLLGLMVYGAILWKLRGTTIGGILCRLQVVRADGRPVDWTTSIVRALSCLLSMVMLGLGFIWIAIDPDRQAWHDKIAGTIVVRTPTSPSLV
ncbi:MAG: RDD family protein [Gammaproteobacteria bacterium]|nr:RDD family protein [Gammaproteobacteria bacterium]